MGTTVFLLAVAGVCATPVGVYLFSSRNMLHTRLPGEIRDSAPYLGIAFLVAILDRIEMRYGESLASLHGWDYTPLIHSLEGDIVVDIQRFVGHGYLTSFLAFMYAVAFTFLLYFSIAFYFFGGEKPLARRVALAYLLNYLLVLPFYLFFPVTETWKAYEYLYGADKISGLLFSFNPDVLGFITTFSAIDNCFPSMHTSLSATLALISLDSKNRRYSLFCTSCAALIIFSTMYLGIHWLADVVAGVLLAVVVHFLCKKIDYEVSFPFSLKFLRVGNRALLGDKDMGAAEGGCM